MGIFLFDAGRWVMRAGKFVYTTCVDCCRKSGPGYWKAIACEQVLFPDICHSEDAPVQPPKPPPIYLIDTIQCFGQPIRAGITVKVGSICYTVIGPHLNELPPGVTLVITAAECKSGCYDDGCLDPTLRSGFARATPCHDNFDPTAPQYYFCKREVQHCVYTKVGDECYKFDPLAPGFFPNPNDIRLRPSPPYFSTCCECVPGCGPCVIYDEYCTPNTGYTQSNFRNCECYDAERDGPNCQMVVTGTFQSWSPGSGVDLIYHVEEITFTGPCSATDGVVSHKRTYEDGLLVEDRTEIVANNSSFFLCNGTTETFNVLQFPISCPINPASTRFWSFRRTCQSVLFELRDGSIGSNGVLISVQVTRNLPTRRAGCEGECGNQSDTPTIGIGPVTPPPPAPVPKEQWPAWARLVSQRKQDGDIGVGSTIEREAGVAGKTFKAAFAALGVDCGCNARRDNFDKQFPYGKE